MKKPIVILHARTVTGSGGGPDKTILRSASLLHPSRYKVTAAYLHPTGDVGIDALRATAFRFGMPMHAIPERGPVDWHAVRLMRDLCKRLNVDIWHAHDYKTDLMGKLLQRSHPMKLVSTMHGFTGESWRTRLYARLSFHALRQYDRVLTVSPQLLKTAVENGIHPDRLHYVPNAIDLGEFKRSMSRDMAKQQIGIPVDEHAIAVVARFSIEKGIDRAIQMFASLHKQRPASCLHLIGDGAQRTELMKQVRLAGLDDHVRWWGWQRDTRRILEAMDTLVLPSRTEGLPNVILEAMAIGLPVAATRVGAVEEVLDHGNCGILFSEHVEAWHAEVLPLIDEPLLRERLLCAAWLRVNERYDFTMRMKRVSGIYDNIMGISGEPLPRRQAA